METSSTQNRPHIALIQTTGIGHLIPLSELARRLALDHNFTITLLIPVLDSPPPAQQTILANLPENINHIILPPVGSNNIPEGSSGEGRLSRIIIHSLPHIREVFESNKFDSLIVDIFGTDAFDVAKEFDVPCYVFFLGSAATLSLYWHLPELDRTLECDLRDLEGPLRLPGCVPLEGKDLMNAVKGRELDSYKWILHHAKRYRTAQGIMVNSFMGLEPGPIKALQESGNPPVYPIGPLIQTGSDEASDCLRWLDDQPDHSVLYISFGSGGTLKHDQFTELAYGLELSKQKFIWVVKSPNDAANAEYYTGRSPTDPLSYLPDGFLDRTKGMGLAVVGWTPQAQILRHVSTGGFLTHCGWNSSLESIVYGVPFIVWPLYAEQKMNAAKLTDDLQIALRPEADENGLVGRGEIARVVKQLMENEESGNLIKKKASELKNLAIQALGASGESSRTLSGLANKMRNFKKI